MVPHPRSKKQRLAFQTFTETPVTTPSTLGFGITHQPHEGGDGAKCGAKFADTPASLSVRLVERDHRKNNAHSFYSHHASVTTG
jgi:hypothetical protein